MPANSMLNTVRPIAASTHPLRASTSGMSHLYHPQSQPQQWSSQCTIQWHSPATPFQRNTRQISKGIGRREHGRSGARGVEVKSLPSSERPPRGGVSGPLVEDDPRYNRVDSSELHAYQARQALLINFAAGEARLDIADAALQIAAEDDAIVTHSPVPLPVGEFKKRISRLANDLGHRVLPELNPEERSPADIIRAVEQYLYVEHDFRLPASGVSGLPAASVVANPGVWEDARHAYVHEMLIRHTGCSAALAVLYASVMQLLLSAGKIDFAVRVDCTAADQLPTAQVLDIPRDMLLRPDGGVLNLASQQVVAEMLRYLKRSYWPFAWDSSAGAGSSTGGFRDAATFLLEGAADAELQAISRVAEHRLERGIFTSAGGGDLRRALAACQRLAILFGDADPIERRDVAVLLMHNGNFMQARVELRAYDSSPEGADASSEERSLVARLLEKLEENLTGAEVVELSLYNLESALAELPPVIPEGRRKALTW